MHAIKEKSDKNSKFHRVATAKRYTGSPAKITTNVITLFIVSFTSEVTTNAATDAMKIAGTTG